MTKLNSGLLALCKTYTAGGGITFHMVPFENIRVRTVQNGLLRALGYTDGETLGNDEFTFVMLDAYCIQIDMADDTPAEFAGFRAYLDARDSLSLLERWELFQSVLSTNAQNMLAEAWLATRDKPIVVDETETPSAAIQKKGKRSRSGTKPE
jgi:hypothetical protein